MALNDHIESVQRSALRIIFPPVCYEDALKKPGLCLYFYLCKGAMAVGCGYKDELKKKFFLKNKTCFDEEHLIISASLHCCIIPSTISSLKFRGTVKKSVWQKKLRRKAEKKMGSNQKRCLISNILRLRKPPDERGWA